MSRLAFYKVIIAAIALYLIVNFFLSPMIGDEIVDHVLGTGNGILIIAGLLCGLGAVRLNRGNLTYQRLRFTKREFPQTYRYLMAFFLFGMIGCMGFAVYFAIKRTGTAPLFIYWGENAVSYLDNLFRSLLHNL